MKPLTALLLLFFMISGCKKESIDALEKKDSTNTLINPSNARTNLKKSAKLYDANGKLGNEDYPWGFQNFDQSGRLIEELSMHPFNYFLDNYKIIGSGVKNTFQYDSEGNLIEKSINDDLYRYEYTAGKLMKTTQYKKSNQKPEPAHVKTTYYKYNNQGLIAWEGISDFNPFILDNSIPRGAELIRYIYDEKNNVIEKLYIDNWSGKPYHSYEGDDAKDRSYQREQFEYSPTSGKVARQTLEKTFYNDSLRVYQFRKHYTDTHSYDTEGRILSVSRIIYAGIFSSDIPVTQSYQYDEKGRLLVMESKEQLTHQITRYTYDASGRILTEYIKYSSLGSHIKEPRDWLLISYQY